MGHNPELQVRDNAPRRVVQGAVGVRRERVQRPIGHGEHAVHVRQLPLNDLGSGIAVGRQGDAVCRSRSRRRRIGPRAGLPLGAGQLPPLFPPGTSTVECGPHSRRSGFAAPPPAWALARGDGGGAAAVSRLMTWAIRSRPRGAPPRANGCRRAHAPTSAPTCSGRGASWDTEAARPSSADTRFDHHVHVLVLPVGVLDDQRLPVPPSRPPAGWRGRRRACRRRSAARRAPTTASSGRPACRAFRPRVLTPASCLSRSASRGGAVHDAAGRRRIARRQVLDLHDADPARCSSAGGRPRCAHRGSGRPRCR